MAQGQEGLIGGLPAAGQPAVELRGPATGQVSAAAEEETFQHRQYFGAGERLDEISRPVLLEHADVVLERVVPSVEGVAELVAFEEPVLLPRLVGRPLVQVDGPADGPESTRPPLDPELDPLLAPGVVEAPKRALRAPLANRAPAHAGRIQSAAMAFRDLFSFLFQRSSAEERVAAYVIREHERGRDLAQILEDRYVQNRLTPDQRERLLDRPEVIRAIGDVTVANARETITSSS